MDKNFDRFHKTVYVHALAIILEKLNIPYKLLESYNVEFDFRALRDLHVNTTNMSVADIDNVIKIVLTK